MVYSSVPSRAYSSKKKLENIPLLQNMRTASAATLRIGRSTKNMEYQFVYQTKGKFMSAKDTEPNKQ